MKKIFQKKLVVVLAILISITVHGQTNVSGGIYANTTWSLSASPYIVTSNVVVFPGFKLTIQPGVVVKFNTGAQIELRQSALIAWGTSTDSITFTSNTSLTPSSWNNIYLNGGTMTSKFNYCNFRYASAGVYDNRGGAGDTLIIKNSNFSYNATGLFGQGTSYGIIDTCNFRHNLNYGVENNYGGRFNNCDISYNNSIGFGCDGNNLLNDCVIRHNTTGMSNVRGCTISNCIINNNQSGVLITMGSSIYNSIIDSNTVVGISNSDVANITSCEVKKNALGINDHNNGGFSGIITKCDIENNSTGIQLSVSTDNISCNKICNNSSYDLKYTGTNNVTAANNYWCTTDSASTQALIYDGHNNISYGLVNFMPLDNSQCYLTTGISAYKNQTISFNIFPNPAINYLTIEFPASVSMAEIRIFNPMGEEAFLCETRTKSKSIDIASFPSGIYIIQVNSGNTIARQKFIKQ